MTWVWPSTPPDVLSVLSLLLLLLGALSLPGGGPGLEREVMEAVKGAPVGWEQARYGSACVCGGVGMGFEWNGPSNCLSWFCHPAGLPCLPSAALLIMRV